LLIEQSLCFLMAAMGPVKGLLVVAFMDYRLAQGVAGRVFSWVSAVLLVIVLSACSTLDTRVAVPEALAVRAQPVGFSQIRVWGDQAGPQLQGIIRSEQARAKQLILSGMAGGHRHHDILALSGGADDGAFGAGLLAGWSQRGDRPNFSTVTGVSAGALIAPFAFLGPAYDPQLKEIYTEYTSSDLFRPQLLSGLLGGNAIADSAPLAALIEKHVDRRLMRQLAQERAKGRLLIVGTTNLDAQRPVFWDVGRIAQSGRPEALELIRSILLASASVPGIFPPVRIRVVVDGETFEEMHVDGGPTRQVFLAPADFSFRQLDEALGQKVERRLWVIRNSKLGPEYAEVPDRTLNISQRSLETLTKYQSIGDIARMHRIAQREGMSFRLASIPPGFNEPRPQSFDQTYMRALFAEGERLGRAGNMWSVRPPG
jgi:predicted acylesterase/phospholipase RssA